MYIFVYFLGVSGPPESPYHQPVGAGANISSPNIVRNLSPNITNGLV